MAGKCKKPISKACTSGGDCISGFCYDKVCCNKACAGACRACNTSGFVGICRNHKAGTDPEKGCGNYNCNGFNACYSSCVKGATCGAPKCKSSAWCNLGKCLARHGAGHNCLYPCSCTSGTCKLFKCK